MHLVPAWTQNNGILITARSTGCWRNSFCDMLRAVQKQLTGYATATSCEHRAIVCETAGGHLQVLARSPHILWPQRESVLGLHWRLLWAHFLCTKERLSSLIASSEKVIERNGDSLHVKGIANSWNMHNPHSTCTYVPRTWVSQRQRVYVLRPKWCICERQSINNTVCTGLPHGTAASSMNLN